MRLPRVWCRNSQPIICAVAVLCCLFLLAERASDRPVVSTCSCPTAAAPERQSRTIAELTPPRADPPVDSSQEEIFTYSANGSIPPHLSQPFQEFLRYRHCRAFPTLLMPLPCEDDLYLLLVVKSIAAQVERREALRDTWGQPRRIQGQRVRLVFLLGRSPEHKHHQLQQQLESESRQHGDILQWDFKDAFFNLTLKETGFLSWFSSKCSKAQFVFKGDDDMFVNTDNLVKFLRAHKPDNHLFTGDIHGRGSPVRESASKYFIPWEIYPNEKYPPFPSGGGYLMSRQTVLGLNEAAQKMVLFPLDDVFVGFCLQKMGLKATHHQGFLMSGFRRLSQHFDPCAYRHIMVLHKLSPAGLRRVWGIMKDPRLTCHR